MISQVGLVCDERRLTCTKIKAQANRVANGLLALVENFFDPCNKHPLSASAGEKT